MSGALLTGESVEHVYVQILSFIQKYFRGAGESCADGRNSVQKDLTASEGDRKVNAMGWVPRGLEQRTGAAATLWI